MENFPDLGMREVLAALPAIAQPLTPRVPPSLADAAVRAVEAVAH